jgi:hypothetical protein
VDVEGSAKPALVAEWLVRLYRLARGLRTAAADVSGFSPWHFAAGFSLE